MFLNTTKILINNVLDIIFPIYCISCGKGGAYLCQKCLNLCPYTERESANWIWPIFDYRHPPIKKMVWLLKYKGKKKLVQISAEILYHKIIEELADLKIMENFNEPILIPIPLSKSRYKERGFNQAELICKEILKIDQNNYLTLEKNILIKTKDTEHQARIKNRGQRLKNVINSFSIKNTEENINKIKNKNIILIDDVTTTGATLSEARKILKSSGARKVIAFTIAH